VVWTYAQSNVFVTGRNKAFEADPGFHYSYSNAMPSAEPFGNLRNRYFLRIWSVSCGKGDLAELRQNGQAFLEVICSHLSEFDDPEPKSYKVEGAGSGTRSSFRTNPARSSSRSSSMQKYLQSAK
jgi:hypothetical protein